jgi:hypothetical protein
MMPQPLLVQCPSCGSGEITYTCEPQCCFNHICGRCYTTFELVTATLGQALESVETPAQTRDSLAPTVACAQCQSIEVYLLPPQGGAPVTLVCIDCHVLLQLVFAGIECR